jgi:four helix bundle protein
MSVPTNIVEGNAHASQREFARFLGYALASASEVEGHARLAERLCLISTQDSQRLLERVEVVRKMLHGLIEHVKSKSQ